MDLDTAISYHVNGSSTDNLTVTKLLNWTHVVHKSDFLKASETIFACVTPIIIVVGLIGNGLSFSVFTSKSLRKLSASTYLVALSLADSSTLVFYVLVEWLRRGVVILSPGLKIEFLDHNGMCQVLVYLAYVSRLMSSWIIVAFTIERFIGICRPLKSFNRSAKKVLLQIFIIGCLLLLYKPIMSISSATRGRIACRPNPEVPEIVSYILDVIFAFLITLIPFIVITVLNLLIVRALFIRNRTGEALTEDDHARIRLEFTVILVAISFFFVAFNFPFAVVWCKYYITSHPLYNMHTFSEVDNDYWIAILNITRTVFYLNYCCNFFLYSITGRCFRKNLLKLLKCKQSSRRPSYMSGRNLGSHTQMSMVTIGSVRRNKV